MIILYWKDAPATDDCSFNKALCGRYEIEETGGKLYVPDIEGPVINDASKVGWLVVPEQKLTPEEYEGGEDEVQQLVKRTVGELNLTYFTPETLPHSIHIAVLASVNTLTKQATVTRKFMGELYDIPNCEPTDYMIEEYKAGKLNIGDKVMVEFMEEYPQDELIIIPVIFAKRST